MEDFAHAAQIETEVVEGGKLILFAVGLGLVIRWFRMEGPSLNG